MTNDEEFLKVVPCGTIKFWGYADKIEVDNIVDTIVEVFPPEKIPLAAYLFGSFAYGEPNGDSDYDICLVTPKPMVYAVSACCGEIFSGRMLKNKNFTRSMEIMVAGDDDFFGGGISMFFDAAREKGILLYKNDLKLDFAWLRIEA